MLHIVLAPWQGGVLCFALGAWLLAGCYVLRRGREDSGALLVARMIAVLLMVCSAAYLIPQAPMPRSPFMLDITSYSPGR